VEVFERHIRLGSIIILRLVLTVAVVRSTKVETHCIFIQ
jgi:hypothetical protein